MSVPFWCLFIVALLPIVLSWVGGYYRNQQFGQVDNKQPRAQAARLEGAGARAYAAQQNAWEALLLFTGAVLVAHLAGATGGQVAQAAMLFVAARVLHAVFYLANLDILRSLVWLVGLVCVIWLYMLALL